MDFFDEYHWHSSLELNEGIKGKKIIMRIRAYDNFINDMIAIIEKYNK